MKKHLHTGQPRGSKTLVFAVALSVLLASHALGQPSVQPPRLDGELIELNAMHAKVIGHLDKIGAAAKPLSATIAEYQSEGSTENATRLLHAIAGVVTSGAEECSQIATLAHNAAELSRSLGAKVTESERIIQSMDATRDANSKARIPVRAEGMVTIESLRGEFAAKGVTNDTHLSAAERARLVTVLRVLRETDLSNKFGTWSAAESYRAAKVLADARERFANNAVAFATVSENYRSFARNFAELGRNLSDVTVAYQMSRTFSAVAVTSSKLRERLESGEAITAEILDSAAPAVEFSRSVPLPPETKANLLGRVSDWWDKLTGKIASK